MQPHGSGVPALDGAGQRRNRTLLENTLHRGANQGLQCAERPALHGLFRQAALKHDHVACYIIREFTAIPGAKPDWEIAETGFFPVERLPDGVTPGTKARLGEILGSQPLAREW